MNVTMTVFHFELFALFVDFGRGVLIRKGNWIFDAQDFHNTKSFQTCRWICLIVPIIKFHVSYPTMGGYFDSFCRTIFTRTGRPRFVMVTIHVHDQTRFFTRHHIKIFVGIGFIWIPNIRHDVG